MANRRILLLLVLVSSGSVGFADAQEPVVTPPSVMLRYRELTNRQALAFIMAGQKYTKPVGDMTMEFPSGILPSAGIDPAVRTFCVEPLVPMYAGEIYPFAVEPLLLPKHFGLPETPENTAAAERRSRFVRELYSRFYQEVAADPGLNAPAFQTALWELTQETEVPEGPMPFSLTTGTFRADYPAEAESPEFVRQAQRYVQALTGDDTLFAQNPALAGLELTRLTALHPVGGAVAGQSQLALRTAPTAVAADSANLGGPAIGGLGGMPTGFGGLRGGGAGGGLGGPAVGGFPGGFGGVGGIGGVGATSPATTTTTPVTDVSTPRSGPDSPVTTLIPTVPVAPGTDTGTSSGGPSNPQPQNPPPPTNPPPPGPDDTPVVPAPAGLVLAGVAAGVLGLRQLRRRAD